MDQNNWGFFFKITRHIRRKWQRLLIWRSKYVTFLEKNIMSSERMWCHDVNLRRFQNFWACDSVVLQPQSVGDLLRLWDHRAATQSDWPPECFETRGEGSQQPPLIVRDMSWGQAFTSCCWNVWLSTPTFAQSSEIVARFVVSRFWQFWVASGGLDSRQIQPKSCQVGNTGRNVSFPSVLFSQNRYNFFFLSRCYAFCYKIYHIGG